MRLHQDGPNARSVEGGALLALTGFTIIAVAGYAVFGLHPELLQRYPELAGLYAPAFVFFAQGHVWFSGAVLAVYLIRRIRLRWLLAFGVVYLISFTAEYLGTGFGLPFGAYHYTDLLGPQWFDRVPWLIPLSWFSMVVPSYVLALQRFPAERQRLPRIFTAAVLLLVWDLSLDPAMSYLTSYWIWGAEGSYYGMPLINLFGWFVTGAVIMTAISWLGTDQWMQSLSVRWMAAYYVVVLLMPFGMVLAAGLYGAAIATAVSVAALGYWIARGGDTADAAASSTVPDSRGVRRSVEHIGAPSADLTDAFFRNHSRSFSFAARLLPKEDRRLLGSLYAFCRTTDDLVDQRTGSSSERVERELTAWVNRARTAYDGGESGIRWLDTLMTTSRDAGVPFALVRQLAAGVRTDMGPVAMQTLEELDQYTYRVASVVGIWMCHLYGVTDPGTLRRAEAMGRAMQTTNILRDVGEDLRHDRVYLPSTLMERHGVSRSDLHAMMAGGEITPGYRSLVHELMTRAEADYEEGFEGLAVLPPAFGRASAAAGAVYRGIHDEIRRNGFDNLRRRAYTSPLRKVRLAAGALTRLSARRMAGGRAEAPIRALVERVGKVIQRQQGWFAIMIFLSMFASAPPAASATEPPWLDRLRTYYVEAVEDEAALEDAEALIEAEARADPTTRAYEGALIVLKAKHAFWPHRKVHYLREGLALLDALVEAHPENVEVRYLRLLSCYFVPSFFGRDWSVRDDFAALSRGLPEVADRFPAELFEVMVRFVLEHGSPDAHQRARLEALVPNSEASPTTSSVSPR